MAQTSKPELFRFFTKVVREEFVNTIESAPENCKNLPLAHRTVFGHVSPELRDEVMENTYKLYLDGPENTVLLYDEWFFLGSDLVYLAPAKRQIILDHFLKHLESSDGRWVIRSVRGIGQVLAPQEAENLMIALGQILLSGEKSAVSAAWVRLLQEYVQMLPPSRAAIRDQAKGWLPEFVPILNNREQKLDPTFVP